MNGMGDRDRSLIDFLSGAKTFPHHRRGPDVKFSLTTNRCLFLVKYIYIKRNVSE